VQHLYRLPALVFAASLSFAFPVIAQGNMSPVEPQPTIFQPTTFQIQAAPLNVLLNDGWFIQSVTGSDGQIIMLFKGTKFARCYLSSPKNPQLRLDFSEMIHSTCHALN